MIMKIDLIKEIIINIIKNIDLIDMIFRVLIIICETTMFAIFVSKAAKPKDNDKIKKIIVVSVLSLFNCLLYFCFALNGMLYVQDLFFLISCMLYVKLFYKNKFIEIMILSFTYFIMFVFIYYILNVLESNLKIDGLLWDEITTIFNLIVIYFSLTKIVVRFMNYKENTLNIKMSKKIAIFSFVGVLFFVVDIPNISDLIGIMCGIAIILLSYEAKLNTERKKEKELINKNIKLKNQGEMIKETEERKYKSYQKSQEAEDNLRKINHDLNHHFNYILSCDNLDQVKEYIKKLKKTVNTVGGYYNTGSSVIDIIFEEARLKAKEDGIIFGVVGGLDEGLRVEPATISVILGNLVNNAIEGAKRVKDEYKRIDITFYQNKEEFYLQVMNTADIEKLKMKKGVFETSKEDKELHGIGLKSVKEEVKAAGGTIEILLRRNKFAVEIHIPFEEENSEIGKENSKK